ncbi:TPA: hypothetical protein ACG0EZ_002613 [Enterobacter ludwigii]
MSTITSEFTNEQLIEHIKGRKEFADECAVDSTLHPERREYYELTAEALRIALASLEAEPVAYLTNSASMAEVITSHHFGGDSVSMRRVAESSKWKPLFTAPPAPVSVPDELSREEYKRRFMEEDDFDDTFRGGWAACRAAMLQGKE